MSTATPPSPSPSSGIRPLLRIGAARRFAMAFPLLFAGVLVVLAAAPAAEAGAGGGSVCFDRVFSFGDSLTDTGNFLLSVPDDFPDPARNLPYGQTFFGRPSGRYSDGRNLLDFFGNLQLSPCLTCLLSALAARPRRRSS